MDQPTGDPKILKKIYMFVDMLARSPEQYRGYCILYFEAIVADVETRKLAREFDNVDHSGTKWLKLENYASTPTAEQIQQAKAIMAKARELRKILRS